MLKRLRWPLLALVLACGLLIVAVATRPESNTPDTTPPATATVPPTSTPPPAPSPTTIAAAPPSSPAAPVTLEEPPRAPENVLAEALVGEIHKLNPLLATYNPVDQDLTSLIFEGLTTTNNYGEIVPDLAESWSVSADGLEYIFTLRDDALWQDGVPFTAEDVALTFDLLGDPEFPGAASLRDFWKTVEVDPLGERMVRFRLTQPLASFPDYLRMGIVPAHVLRGTPVSSLWRHPFNLSPIGTGPYQIETLTASGGHIDGIQLRVAPVYRQRPEGAEGYTLDRLVFRVYPTTDAALDAYRRGEVNSIASIPHDQLAAAARLPGLSLYTAIEPHVGVLIYNWKRDAVSFVRNPRARIALAQAVDRTALVMQDLSGRAIPANSPLLPDSWAYDPSVVWPAYNLAQAQAMLDMANLSFGAPPVEATPTEGAPSPEPGTVDEETQPEPEPTDENTGSAGTMHKALTILTPNDPALVALAEGIASGWEQLGFAVAVEPVGAAALHARLEAGDFDAALVELSFEPYADPDSYVFWHQGQYRTSQNYGGMDDRRLSEALEQARREPLGLNRAVYYRRFQELFAERALALTLYYPFYTYAVDARVEGIQLSFMSVPADRFRSIQDWTIGGS